MEKLGNKSLVGSIFIQPLCQKYQVATGVEVELRNRFPSPIQALLQKKNKMLEEALQLALKAQEKVLHPRVFGGLPGVKPYSHMDHVYSFHIFTTHVRPIFAPA